MDYLKSFMYIDPFAGMVLLSARMSSSNETVELLHPSPQLGKKKFPIFFEIVAISLLTSETFYGIINAEGAISLLN